MLALVKTHPTRAPPGVPPDPVIGINDVLIGSTGRASAARTSTSNRGSVASRTIVPRWSSATSSSARSSRSAPTSPTSAPATWSAARAMSSAAAAGTALPAAATCAPTPSAGVVGRCFAEYALPMTNVWHHWPASTRVAAISTVRQRGPHGARVPGARRGRPRLRRRPIGLMATAVVRHAGARHVVSASPTPTGAGWPCDGRDGRRDPRERQLADVWRARHVEDSTWRSRCRATRPPSGRDRQHAHGAVSPCSASVRGHRPDMNQIVFKMLTVKGIYGARCTRPGYR